MSGSYVNGYIGQTGHCRHRKKDVRDKKGYRSNNTSTVMGPLTFIIELLYSSVFYNNFTDYKTTHVIPSENKIMFQSINSFLLSGFPKQVPTDIWSTRERLALAASVMRSGDQNW